jgi:hypothetical protein
MITNKIETFQEIFYQNNIQENLGTSFLNKLPAFVINFLRRYAVKYLKMLKATKPESFETLYNLYKDKNTEGIKDIARKQIESKNLQTEEYTKKKFTIAGAGGIVTLLGAIGMFTKAWAQYTPENLPNIPTTEIVVDIFVSLIVLAIPFVTGAVIDNYEKHENAEAYIDDLEKENKILSDTLEKLKTQEHLKNQTDMEIER